MRSVEPVSLGWIFRPERADNIGEHAGKPVRFAGTTADESGQVELVLTDGTRVRAYRHEVVPG
ncbi:hypothetical protein [Micromonospora sp. MA102]|uniref:hypothetical protein n=1 Tax=Micromonospora sp. MA102 TaxID=2952755 RepID=UPI0029056B2D|nr:hypothetical protein [Micromonospora sp. MA102]